MQGERTPDNKRKIMYVFLGQHMVLEPVELYFTRVYMF